MNDLSNVFTEIWQNVLDTDQNKTNFTSFFSNKGKIGQFNLACLNAQNMFN